ncbi:endonuclease/exonuclease/phosphatase family protein [Amycolatopsis saalfeldensis]|uniref:Endonuclease/Exonuclease/phosphatase family protein n=1 Tax=Amycolatopsis saalfeldensis TaxID=394193 RepID=A0A1H8YQK2_9PSEU|nr:endonuclease/exonuclease/phosphatase family protein [Amycolatopsis saalfeldensis]SEP54281.1 Endonuclease/Exonuclease/phosphatase family protein [Amycolatopsis saalfeldensis]
MLLCTANLFDYNKSPIDADRQLRERETILAAAPDVLCVQEFWHATRAPDDPALARAFAEFCDQLGMVGRLAYAPSFCHVGVLWRPGSASVESWQEYSRWQWHHGLGMAVLDIGAAAPIRVATTQLHPADPAGRFTEAGYLAMAGLGNPNLVTFLGADFNAAGREPALPGQHGSFYDPEPYHDQQRGLPHQQFQVEWNDDPDAEPLLDRRALERARRAGLVDIAHHLGVSWRRTSGHHPGDPHGDRRPDGWRGSVAALPLVTHYQVDETADSDHALVSIRIAPERIGNR